MSELDRDAAKAAKKAAKERAKRGKQIARLKAAREKERAKEQAAAAANASAADTSGMEASRKSAKSGAQLDVIYAKNDGSEGRGLYWVMRNILLGPPVKRIFAPVVEGVENVPQVGAAILAANHLSFADWLFMPLALDRRVTFVAKSDYFTGEGLKGWAQRRFFAGTGQVPVDRSGGRASEGALRAGIRVLERGDLFGIFPEGTRSHDGRLYKGRTGVARIALEAQVPVIPVGVVGTDVIAPPGKLISKVISPTVKFGKPLDFSRYEGMSEDRFILRSVTDEIMYAIMELTGQEYVDMYAPTAKELAAKQAKQEEEDEVSPQA